MRAEEIMRLIRKEDPFDERTQSELDALLEEYPWFQAARLLYLLNLHQLRDSRFPAELRRAAAYIPDRQPLFFLVQNDFFQPEKIRKISEPEDHTHSSFDLIDFFLKEQNSPDKGRITPTEEEGSFRGENKQGSAVSTDYLSIFLSEEENRSHEAVPPMKHQEKIDRFITAGDKTPFRLELKEEAEKLLPEEEEIGEGDFFSETLAKIYIKQKKYDKALKIIRELNLLYPEKNRYFADQIRFLEKLIINTQK